MIADRATSADWDAVRADVLQHIDTLERLQRGLREDPSLAPAVREAFELLEEFCATVDLMEV